MDSESGRRLVLLNNMLVKQTCMDKVLRGVIDQSVSVFEGFVNRLCGDLINTCCVSIQKPYSNNLVECAVALTHVPGAGAISMSRPSVNESEIENGPSI